MASYTPTQGRYLAYIHNYRKKRGVSPSEAEIATAMCVAPPSVNQMIKNLEKRGLVLRQPGVPRSVRVLISEDEIPTSGRNGVLMPAAKSNTKVARKANEPEVSSISLYVLYVYIYSGPLSGKFCGKECGRAIEIRGDQTLHDLHGAIFNAYDRWEDHPYEFQFGRRANDSDGPNYRAITSGRRGGQNVRDAKKTRLDDLDMTLHRTFGYLFDFGDYWFHHVQVENIDTAIPRVIVTS